MDGSRISRRAVLASGAALGLGASAGGAELAAAPPPRGRPNILWLVSEDNNPWLGCYGDRLAHTPNLDALAAKGVVFDNAFSSAPVCAPSRFAILTGLHAEANAPAQHMRADAHLPDVLPTYPALLRRAGYYCTNNDKTDYNCDVDPKAIWDESSKAAHWRGRNGDQPFMAVFNTLTTHERFIFKPTPGKVSPADVTLPDYLPDLPEVRQDFASYHNLMEKMDGEFGARLAELEADALAEDTIVFYYGDNGGIMPRTKHYPWNEGFRCPLIVYVPPKWRHLSPVPMGSRVATPVNFVDLAPTLLSLAGIPVPAVMQGSPFLGTEAKPPRTITFGARDRMDERDGMVRVAMDDRWHYMRTYKPHRPYWAEMAYPWQMKSYQAWEAAWRKGTLPAVQSAFFEVQPYEQLFDLQADPDQTRNLAADPGHRATLQRLSQALDEHMLEIRDNGFVPEGSVLEGWEATRINAAYPLPRIMKLAAKAASRDAKAVPEFVAALGDANEVVRYWAGIGLLLSGSRAHDAWMLDALRADRSPHVRMVIAEALVAGAYRSEAITTLAALAGEPQTQPVRLAALNALTFAPIGKDAVARAAAVVACEADELQLRNAARYLVQHIDGTYDPRKPVFDRAYFAAHLPKD